MDYRVSNSCLGSCETVCCTDTGNRRTVRGCTVMTDSSPYETPTLTSTRCEPMATMTPAALLVGFCAVMAAIAIGRLALDPNRDPIDIGTALVVAGITVLAVLWAALVESWLGTVGRLGIVIVGGTATVVGIALIVRHWGDPVDGSDREPGRGDS